MNWIYSVVVVTNDELEMPLQAAIHIQINWRRHNHKKQIVLRIPYLIIFRAWCTIAKLVGRNWQHKLNWRKLVRYRLAILTLQAHGRRRFYWGISDEVHDTVISALEMKLVRGAVKSAFLLITFFQGIVYKEFYVPSPDETTIMDERFNNVGN
jgi:hypothetical protein